MAFARFQREREGNVGAAARLAVQASGGKRPTPGQVAQAASEKGVTAAEVQNILDTSTEFFFTPRSLGGGGAGQPSGVVVEEKKQPQTKQEARVEMISSLLKKQGKDVEVTETGSIITRDEGRKTVITTSPQPFSLIEPGKPIKSASKFVNVPESATVNEAALRQYRKPEPRTYQTKTESIKAQTESIKAQFAGEPFQLIPAPGGKFFDRPTAEKLFLEEFTTDPKDRLQDRITELSGTRQSKALTKGETIKLMARQKVSGKLERIKSDVLALGRGFTLLEKQVSSKLPTPIKEEKFTFLDVLGEKVFPKSEKVQAFRNFAAKGERFGAGALEGLREKPLTIAAEVQAFTYLPGAISFLGKATGISKVIAKIPGKYRVTAKVGAALGMGTLITARAGSEIVQAEDPIREAGKVAVTDIAPFVVGGIGSTLVRGRSQLPSIGILKKEVIPTKIVRTPTRIIISGSPKQIAIIKAVGAKTKAVSRTTTAPFRFLGRQAKQFGTEVVGTVGQSRFIKGPVRQPAIRSKQLIDPTFKANVASPFKFFGRQALQLSREIGGTIAQTRFVRGPIRKPTIRSKEIFDPGFKSTVKAPFKFLGKRAFDFGRATLAKIEGTKFIRGPIRKPTIRSKELIDPVFKSKVSAPFRFLGRQAKQFGTEVVGTVGQSRFIRGPIRKPTIRSKELIDPVFKAKVTDPINFLGTQAKMFGREVGSAIAGTKFIRGPIRKPTVRTKELFDPKFKREVSLPIKKLGRKAKLAKISVGVAVESAFFRAKGRLFPTRKVKVFETQFKVGRLEFATKRTTRIPKRPRTKPDISIRELEIRPLKPDEKLLLALRGVEALERQGIIVPVSKSKLDALIKEAGGLPKPPRARPSRVTQRKTVDRPTRTTVDREVSSGGLVTIQKLRPPRTKQVQRTRQILEPPKLKQRTTQIVVTRIDLGKRSKQDQRLATLLGQPQGAAKELAGSLSLPQQISKQIPQQISKQIPKQTQRQIPTSIVKQITRQVPGQIPKQIPAQTPAQISLQDSILITIKEKPRPKPPIKFPDFEKGRTKAKKRRKKLTRQFKYNPSIVAKELGIVGKQPKTITGLGIRPITPTFTQKRGGLRPKSTKRSKKRRKR